MNTLLLSKIYSEGYCCLRGYLGLCKARGETVKDMAEFIDITKGALWYHYRELAKGRVLCEKRSDCLGPIIDEMKKNPGG